MKSYTLLAVALNSVREKAVKNPKSPAAVRWAFNVFILHGLCGDLLEPSIAPAHYILDLVPQDMQLYAELIRLKPLHDIADVSLALGTSDVLVDCYALRVIEEVLSHPPGG